MAARPTDDIFALCARFNLDQESYRVFAKREAPPQREPLARPQKETARTTATEIHAVPRPAEPAAPLPEEYEPAGPDLIRPEATRSALLNLCRHLRQTQDRRPKPRRNARELRQEALAVVGAAGGVGATTVAVTLAHLLARSGRHCAIADGRRRSLLPFLLEGHALSCAHQRHTAAPGCAGAVRILAPAARLEEASDPASFSSWMDSSLENTPTPIDQLVLDVWDPEGQPIFAELDPPGAVLLVAVPDVSSVLGAGEFKARLAAQAPQLAPLCILNKFDPSVPLHIEIRSWFEQNFSRTLPLSRSDLACEALAEGLTIVDWAPDSALARDYLRLLETLNLLAAPLLAEELQ